MSFQKGHKINVGRVVSTETRKKIGAGNAVSLKGKKHSQETIEKRRVQMMGDKNPAWKGGVCRDKKYIDWQKNKRNRLKKVTAKNLGTHTYGEWELLKKQHNYTCPCCKLSEPFNQKSQYLTEDHIIPLSKGGSDLIENIQPLCLSCNMKKHTLIIKY